MNTDRLIKKYEKAKGDVLDNWQECKEDVHKTMWEAYNLAYGQILSDLNELKEEPKGLRWVKAEDRNPTKEGMHICIVSVKDKGLIYEPVSYMGFYSGAWRKNLNGAPCTIIKWLEETPLEAAQNIKP